MRNLLLIASLVVLPSTSVGAQSLAEMSAAAKAILAERVTDPGSLQYRKMRVVAGEADGSNGLMLCGQYNAKNRLGGYVGYKDFIYDPRKKLLVSLGGNFFSDIDGDFSLDEFSSAKISGGTDIAARAAELKKWISRYERYLLNCA